MPYSQFTLDQLAIQIGVLLDDTSEVYWTRQEKYYAIYEGLRVWGALTSYWRTRGTFNTVIGQPYYDLSVQLPTLRTRTWTLGQMVAEIQYHCLEAANGIAGTGMSGQVSITSILNAIQRARNRFVLDAHIPLAVSTTNFSVPPLQGMVTFDQSVVYVHRASWIDSTSGIWQNLWRQDAWLADKSNVLWTLQPGMPKAFSESENSPLKLQLYAPPINAGTMEAITVQSLILDLTSATTTFNVPDEWIHAVKYAALADLFESESQMKDPLRAQYAELRYQQAVSGVQNIRSIIRLLLNNYPLNVDTFQSVDAGVQWWRNQTGQPFVGGVLSDFLMTAPVSDQIYGIAADVVQSAPLPANGAAYLQIGVEDMDHLTDYCVNYLCFKCGGNEFKHTFRNYDGYMRAVETRVGINKAKIQYLEPLFAQPQKEEAVRPDVVMSGAGNGAKNA